jgi:hypothetical protein
MDSDLLARLQAAEARCSMLLEENAQIKGDMLGLVRTMSLSLASEVPAEANKTPSSVPPLEPQSIIPDLPSLSLQRARSHPNVGDGLKEAVTLCAGDLIWMQENGNSMLRTIGLEYYFNYYSFDKRWSRNFGRRHASS